MHCKCLKTCGKGNWAFEETVGNPFWNFANYFLQCDPNGSQEAKIPVIDRIIAVCAALTDLSNGIVPLDEKIVLVMTTSCFFKLVCLRKILLTM